jgi:ABC-type branched-subunit amino acid transport system substrate-binding protein
VGRGGLRGGRRGGDPAATGCTTRGSTAHASGWPRPPRSRSIGPDQRWFSAAYQRVTGVAPPYPAAAAYAAGVLWQHCSSQAGTTEPDAVAAVAAGLHTTTLFEASGLTRPRACRTPAASASSGGDPDAGCR